MEKRWKTYLLSVWLTGFLFAILANSKPAPAAVPTAAVAHSLLKRSHPVDGLLPVLQAGPVHAPVVHPLPQPLGKVFPPPASPRWRQVLPAAATAVPRPVPVFLAYFRHLFRHGISINAP